MKKLNVKQKNWLVSAHVISGAIWFGTAICMVAISLSNTHTNEGNSLFAINSILKTLDDFIIIPSATASLLTGALLSWLTIWGFFKHYWVTFKWIATVSLITFGTLWLGPWVNTITSISEMEKTKALANPLYSFDAKAALIGGVIQTISIAFIIAVSILKPWGRRVIDSQAKSQTQTKAEG